MYKNDLGLLMSFFTEISFSGDDLESRNKRLVGMAFRITYLNAIINTVWLIQKKTWQINKPFAESNIEYSN